jgi:septal ring factor EnvC (AmiA/AmiB activator)
MNSLTDLLKSAQENPQIAIFIGLATLVLILLFYMFIKSMFAGPVTTPAPLATAQAMGAPINKTLEKLQAASQEGSLILRQLQDNLAEKDLLIAEKQKYIDKLAQQEAELQAQLKQGFSPAEAVEKQYRGRVDALQAQLTRAGRGRFWGGWFTGFLSALVLVAAYLAYLKIGKGLDLAPLLAF